MYVFITDATNRCFKTVGDFRGPEYFPSYVSPQMHDHFSGSASEK